MDTTVAVAAAALAVAALVGAGGVLEWTAFGVVVRAFPALKKIKVVF